MFTLHAASYAQNLPQTAPLVAPAVIAANVDNSGLSINDWLLKMHEAAMKKRSFTGTLVQSSSQGMASARIWHACDGAQQIERVETDRKSVV